MKMQEVRTERRMNDECWMEPIRSPLPPTHRHANPAINTERMNTRDYSACSSTHSVHKNNNNKMNANAWRRQRVAATHVRRWHQIHWYNFRSAGRCCVSRAARRVIHAFCSSEILSIFTVRAIRKCVCVCESLWFARILCRSCFFFFFFSMAF